MIISRTYVDTKILLQFYKAIENSDISISPFFSKLNKQVQDGIKMFNNGNTRDFVDYYQNTPLTSNICEHILKEQHSHELNIFLERMNNPYIQKSINNYIGGRTPYSIKVFTSDDKLCSNVDEGNNLIQPVHDYKAESIFKLSSEEQIVSEK